MAFDMGFNFRATSGYVTDGPEGVPVLAEAYPHTYTNGNGYSVNGGWTGVYGAGKTDRANTNDPKIAGDNDEFLPDNQPETFNVDLSSGSAPGAATYTVDLAVGSTIATTADFQLKDNTTVRIDGTNGGAGTSLSAGHYLDATLADIAASTTWTGTTTNVNFATTSVQVVIGVNTGLSGHCNLAHFRLTLQAGGSAVTRSMLMLLGVGA